MNELSNKKSTQSSSKSKTTNKNNDDVLSNRSLNLSSKDFDCKIKSSLEKTGGRNEYNNQNKALSNKSSNVSYDTHNSSNVIQNMSQGLDIHSEINIGNISDRSFREKESNYHVSFLLKIKFRI